MITNQQFKPNGSEDKRFFQPRAKPGQRKTTPLDYARTAYRTMRTRVTSIKSYSGRQLLCDKDTFIQWALNNPDFQSLYAKWKQSGRVPAYAPVVDRINNDGHYSLDNIQILSAEAHLAKTVEERIERSKRQIIDGRPCHTCGLVQPLENFHRNKNCPLGRIYDCKKCTKPVDRARKMIWRAKRKQKLEEKIK